MSTIYKTAQTRGHTPLTLPIAAAILNAAVAKLAVYSEIPELAVTAESLEVMLAKYPRSYATLDFSNLDEDNDDVKTPWVFVALVIWDVDLNSLSYSMNH